MEITRNYSAVTENWTNDGSPDSWDDYEYMDEDWPFRTTQKAIVYFASIVLPILLLYGGFSNILAFVVLIRQRHLQHQHEGCLYLATMFVTNLCILFSVYLHHWYYYMEFPSLFHQTCVSLIVCKVWHLLALSAFDIPSWLIVALLFGVYLREHLVVRRRCGCPNFAKKYCTVFASKIIIGIIVGFNLAYNLPQFYWSQLHDTGSETICYSFYEPGMIVMYYIRFVVVWILPVVFLVPVILLLVLCTKPVDGDFRFSQINERYAVEAEFRKLTIFIASIFFLATFLKVSINFFHSFSHFHSWMSHMSSVLSVVYCLSLGINPTLSLILISEFRKEVQSIFRRMCFCFRGCYPNVILLQEHDESECNVLDMDAIEDVPLTSTDG